jgi:hypothetical protein
MIALIEAAVFAIVVALFTLGLSSVIIGLLPKKNTNGVELLKQNVEYGFFGVGGLVLAGLFFYLLMSLG